MPSARRATIVHHHPYHNSCDFYPRPPRGGRPAFQRLQKCVSAISIHALREEGDLPSILARQKTFYVDPRPPRGGRPPGCTWSMAFAKFLSTPSARRATRDREPERDRLEISIHALREEGDVVIRIMAAVSTYFYPRPPRGGRLNNIASNAGNL